MATIQWALKGAVTTGLAWMLISCSGRAEPVVLPSVQTPVAAVLPGATQNPTAFATFKSPDKAELEPPSPTSTNTKTPVPTETSTSTPTATRTETPTSTPSATATKKLVTRVFTRTPTPTPGADQQPTGAAIPTVQNTPTDIHPAQPTPAEAGGPCEIVGNRTGDRVWRGSGFVMDHDPSHPARYGYVSAWGKVVNVDHNANTVTVDFGYYQTDSFEGNLVATLPLSGFRGFMLFTGVPIQVGSGAGCSNNFQESDLLNFDLGKAQGDIEQIFMKKALLKQYVIDHIHEVKGLWAYR